MKGSIEEGHLINESGTKVYGIKCFGIPIRSEEYIKEFLRVKANKISKTIEDTGNKMNPTQIMKPEMPGRQCLWQILLRCLQHVGNYWARHIPSNQTESFCKTVDKPIYNLITTTLELDTTIISETTKERIRLSVRFKGLGMRSLEDRRY